RPQRRSTPAHHIEFFADENATRVQRNASFPVGHRTQIKSCPSNLTIWDAKPNNVGVKLGIFAGRSVGTCCGSQLFGFSFRSSTLSCHNLANSISRAP